MWLGCSWCGLVVGFGGFVLCLWFVVVWLDARLLCGLVVGFGGLFVGMWGLLCVFLLFVNFGWFVLPSVCFCGWILCMAVDCLLVGF